MASKYDVDIEYLWVQSKWQIDTREMTEVTICGLECILAKIQ